MNLGELDPAQVFDHSLFLRRVAQGLCGGDSHRAEDLVQDTWVQALEKPPKKPGALRGWMNKVLRHRAWNQARTAAHRSKREAEVACDEVSSPEDSHEVALERVEFSRQLFELVSELPEEKQTVLYLRYYEDLQPKEIAERLDVPIKTIRTRLSRGLNDLREALDRRYGGRCDLWMGLSTLHRRPHEPHRYDRGRPVRSNCG